MNVFFSERDQSRDGCRNNLSLSLYCSSRLMLITMSALSADEYVVLYVFSTLQLQPQKSPWKIHHHGNTFFLFLLEKMLLLQDERPDGEDIPHQLRHSIWCDPDWHCTLPETGYTCGSGEADGLYIYGTTPVLPFFVSGCLMMSYSVGRSHSFVLQKEALDLAFAVESRGLPGGLRLNSSKVTTL